MGALFACAGPPASRGGKASPAAPGRSRSCLTCVPEPARNQRSTYSGWRIDVIERGKSTAGAILSTTALGRGLLPLAVALALAGCETVGGVGGSRGVAE